MNEQLVSPKLVLHETLVPAMLPEPLFFTVNVGVEQLGVYTFLPCVVGLGLVMPTTLTVYTPPCWTSKFTTEDPPLLYGVEVHAGAVGVTADTLPVPRSAAIAVLATSANVTIEAVERFVLIYSLDSC